MKKFFYISILGIAICSCDTEDAPTTNSENNAPEIPTLSAPTNNELCINNFVEFKWNSSTDPDGDDIAYQIQVAKDNNFSQIIHTFSISSTNKSISLEKGIPFYWRVKAIDSKNLSSDYSTTYTFYTEGDGGINYLPFSPELIKPNLGSSVQTETTTLEWNASDVDPNDVLSFDVYFGTSNPPTSKISNKQSAKTLDVNLNASTVYYWKVVVTDNKGGETIGQVWRFNKN